MHFNTKTLAVSELTAVTYYPWLQYHGLVGGMKYNEDRHKCTIDLLRFCEFLDALPEVMKEEV